MQIKKWQIILVIAVLIVLASGAVWILTKNEEEEVCSERGMAGECLAEGKCAAPNDAIVSCEKLRQNPEKTDWLGNE